jgi:hypothetical protein
MEQADKRGSGSNNQNAIPIVSPKFYVLRARYLHQHELRSSLSQDEMVPRLPVTRDTTVDLAYVGGLWAVVKLFNPGLNLF